jgi:glycosyltransferase involved in cell wall biosynthesis
MSNETSPKVTVLMAVHNGEQHLMTAIDSILQQSFTDFEFLIIDDASEDDSVAIINSYQDPRIKLISNDSQLNLAGSLNKGLGLARGQYLARMDADDISCVDRLALQVDYLDAHPDCGICGTWIRIFNDHDNRTKLVKFSDDFLYLKSYLLLGNIFAHPSVMLRLSLFQKFQLTYNEHFSRMQDYELWTRAIEYFPVTNLPQILLNYRANPNGSKIYQSPVYQSLLNELRKQQLLALGITVSAAEITLHNQFGDASGPFKLSFFVQLISWLKKIVAANQQLAIYPDNYLRRIIKLKLIKLPFSMIRLRLNKL